MAFKIASKTSKSNKSPAATNNGTVPKTPGKKLADPVAKLLAVESWANTRVVGREDIVKAFVLAVAAKANLMMIGPPGTAKTYAVQLVASAFATRPGDVFDILLTKFTKPVEVFGPLSLKGLEEDVVRYVTDGFLPKCIIGVVDEVWKGSSAINNSLLRIGNERTFQNGNVTETCPMRSMVGMSNEFPEDPALLAAAYDRFPIKLIVQPLDANPFAAMLSLIASGGGDPAPSVSMQDLAAIDALVSKCVVPQEIIDAIADLRESLRVKNVRASDRRYAQSIRILKAAAVLSGRDRVTRADLKVLVSVLWSEPNDIAVIKAVVENLLNPFEKQLRSITDEAYEEARRVLAAGNYDGADKARPSPDNVQASLECAKALARVRGVITRLDAINDLAESDADTAMLEEARNATDAIQKILFQVSQGKGKLAELAALASNA